MDACRLPGKTVRLYQVDSFTTHLFKGNPAGVVPDADDLTVAQMQAIAREMNNSEIAFILSPIANDHVVTSVRRVSRLRDATS